MTARHYRERIAWRKAMDFADMVYDATEAFPKKEMSGLTNQVRRPAISIPANIAEGQGRRSTCASC